MGAWGTGIFSNDTASDLKTAYQALLAFGTPEDEAYQLIFDKYINAKVDVRELFERNKQEFIRNFESGLLTKEYFDANYEKHYGYSVAEDVIKEYDKVYNRQGEDEDHVDFWFAVAAIQVKYGILMDEVKERALRCIDEGFDELMWEDADKRDLKAREKVRNKLKADLLAPPLPKRKVPKPRISKPRWQIGDVVISQIVCPDYKDKWFYNKYVLYRVIRLDRSSVTMIKPDLAYDEWVYGALYNWIGDEPPAPEILDGLDYYRCTYYERGHKVETFSMYWIPRNQRFTLFQRGTNHPLPAEDDVHIHATGNNIFSVMSSSYEELFKSLYEQFKK